MKKDNQKEKDFISFLNESGLVWGPSPEIYGGLSGFYEYGPLGKLLKNKVERSIRNIFTSNGLMELECPTILPDEVWNASGHLNAFKNKLIKCSKCNAIFRVDKLIEEKTKIIAEGLPNDKLLDLISKNNISCPSCKGKLETSIDTQSLMMKTNVAGKEASLRPETATVTYLPYLRLYNYFRKKLPFGVFQIGKAYRNEISPRQSVLRGREFTQGEGQIFIDPKTKNNWEKYESIKDQMLPLWDYKSQKSNLDNTEIPKIKIDNALKKGILKSQAYAWCLWLAYTQFINFGIPEKKMRIRQHHPDEMAFYAEDAWDIEIKLNFYGWVEVCGIHDRTDYDLKQHSKFSGKELVAQREDGSKFTPHILEIAFGTDRPTYALIDIFYEKKEESSGKTTFKIPYKMAPIEVSVFPLIKNDKGILKLSEKVKEILENEFIIDYDSAGSIGRRYLRSSTAGTPFAVTIDGKSLIDNDVTIRDRDSEKQIRIKIPELSNILRSLLLEKISFKDFL
ncbi:glycine--tRNA ligase [Patescibacteria group bacterium]|nr:glycine--tRNA ligase [Patescibacteria group bacterium]